MRALIVVLPLLITVLPGTGEAGDLSIDEQGARHGQAVAAAKLCPGARQTAKTAALAASIPEAEREAFEAASRRIQLAWDKATECRDVDPAQYPREFNSCRKTKILNCSATWTEIGPEGSALPGLLEFAPFE